MRVSGAFAYLQRGAKSGADAGSYMFFFRDPRSGKKLCVDATVVIDVKNDGQDVYCFHSVMNV